MRAQCLSVLAALLAAATPVSPAAPQPSSRSGDGNHVVLLGTGGGPIARVSRAQPASLLQVGRRTYLIDVGAGTERQIARASTRLDTIDVVFITHLHFDHTAGLPAFIALDWQARRRDPVSVLGPPGTQELVANALRFLGSGEAIFAPQLPDLPPIAAIFASRDLDITTPAAVYSDEQVTVRAVENTHYGTMHLPRRGYGPDRSYSYRFETRTRTIVFTGDTGPSKAVEELARDADLLVSEVIDLQAVVDSLRKRGAEGAINMQPLIAHMEQEHLSPESVGKLAAAARVKQVLLTHFAVPPGVEAINQKGILDGIRKHYSGPVTFGEDLGVY